MKVSEQVKVVLWAFFGSGKSFLADDESIIDLDFVHYKYIGVNTNPHNHENADLMNGSLLERNIEYPQNYIQAIQDSKAKVVLVNCEIPLLEKLENVVLYYPDLSLKQEYLERYQKRGDNSSFLHMIEQDYDGMIHSLGQLPYPKFVAHENKKYLSDIFQGGKIDMSQFILKKELSHLIEEAKSFDVHGYGFFSDYELLTADDIAQEVFEGKINLDIDGLREEVRKKQIEYENSFRGTYVYEDDKKLKVIEVVRGRGNQENEIWVRERKGTEQEKYQYYGFRIFDKNGVIPENFARFQDMLENGYHKTCENLEVGTIEKRDLEGFTHEEAVQLVQDAIACGALILHHDQVQPYSYGFECQYPGKNTYIPDMDADPFIFPELMVRNIELNKIEHHAFVSSPIRYSDISLRELKVEVDAKKEQLNDVSIVPYHTTKEYFEHERNRYTRGLIGNDQHIDTGYGVDGIIRGQCGGDYSSMTTGSQNDWMRAAVALRGFCLDYIHDCLTERKPFPYLQNIAEFYQSKGLDLTDKNQVIQWCLEHPNKCYSEKYIIRQEKTEDYLTEEEECEPEL